MRLYSLICDQVLFKSHEMLENEKAHSTGRYFWPYLMPELNKGESPSLLSYSKLRNKNFPFMVFGEQALLIWK